MNVKITKSMSPEYILRWTRQWRAAVQLRRPVLHIAMPFGPLRLNVPDAELTWTEAASAP